MEENKTTIVSKTVKSGITFGRAWARAIIYTTGKPLGGAIFQGWLIGEKVINLVLPY